jgi:hypothetical protein
MPEHRRDQWRRGGLEAALLVGKDFGLGEVQVIAPQIM